MSGAVKQPKKPSKRTVALTTARVAGFENDTKTYTRLMVEARVNRQDLMLAWLEGCGKRVNGQSLEAA